MNNARQSGFTIIELIMFIIVVGVGVTGILTVMNITVQHSADPMVRKQAAALADSILDEILLKAYQDPDGGVNVVEGSPNPDRTLLDDVDDYNGLSNAAFTDLPAALSLYTITIEVSDGTTILGVTAKQVTVTVAGGTERVTMTGYRSDY